MYNIKLPPHTPHFTPTHPPFYPHRLPFYPHRLPFYPHTKNVKTLLFGKELHTTNINKININIYIVGLVIRCDWPSKVYYIFQNILCEKFPTIYIYIFLKLLYITEI